MASAQYVAVDVPLAKQAARAKHQAAHIQSLTGESFHRWDLCREVQILAPFKRTLCVVDSQEQVKKV